jgi:uncharacterized membrane protein
MDEKEGEEGRREGGMSCSVRERERSLCCNCKLSRSNLQCKSSSRRRRKRRRKELNFLSYFRCTYGIFMVSSHAASESFQLQQFCSGRGGGEEGVRLTFFLSFFLGSYRIFMVSSHAAFASSRLEH